MNSTAVTGNWGASAPASTTIASPAGKVTAALTASAPSGSISLAPVPATDVSAMSADQIMTLLHSLQPAAVADAGRAHTALGRTLANLADRLSFHAQDLAENWTGTAATNAVASLKQIHAQTLTTAQAATAAGAVLNWLGNTVLPQFKNLPDPRSGLLNASGSIVTGVEHAASDLTGSLSATEAANVNSAADTVARSYLTALNTYLVEANNNLPTQTGTSSNGGAAGEPLRLAPNPSGITAGASTSGKATGRATVPSPASGRGATSKGGSAATTGGSRSSGKTGSVSPGSSGGSSAPPGSLQSVPVQPGNAGSPSQVVPGGPASGIGDIGSGTGVAAGNPSAPGLAIPGLSRGGYPIQPGNPSTASNGVPGEESTPLASGAPGSQDVAATSGAGTASAEGETGGFPMMGGAAPGQSDKERRRQAWMNDDDGIWGAPTDCVPSVIEGTDWIWKRK
jgi:hypothetical protein